MKFLLLLAVLLSTGCNVQDAQDTPAGYPPPVVGPSIPTITVDTGTKTPDVLYACDYKYDSKYNVQFLARERLEYHPPSLPELLVYRITDIRGQRWVINEYDWKNYTCITTTLSQG